MAHMFESWYRDLVQGLRGLRKNPVFALTAILTLGLGIGANTAIFSFLYGLVLRSVPTPAPWQLMRIGITSTAAEPIATGTTFVPYLMLSTLRSELTSVSAISGWDEDDVLMEDNQGALRAYPAALVTGNAFQVVSMQPYLGRLTAPFDDVCGGPAQGWPVVLSYGFWSDHYGKDPGIVGKRIRLSGTEVTVVGVTRPEFKGVWPGNDIKMYLPIHFINVLAKEDVLDNPQYLYGCSLIGRIKPGVSIAKANAEVVHLEKNLLARFIPVKYQHLPFFQYAYMRVDSARIGLPSYVTRTYAKPLYLMQGLVGVVLVLCCLNVGGLMLAKVYSRQREFAVRTALGAGLWRLVRQYLTESFVIAILGGTVGAALAWRGCDVLLHFFRDPMMGEAMSVHPDRSMFFAAGFFALLTTLLFGMLPAWRAGHSDPGELLKSRTNLGGRRQIAGRMFIPLQVAVSLVLVVLASLLSESIVKLRSERTGFDIDHVTIQTSPLYLLRKNGEAKLNLYQRLVDRISEMPNVRAAAATSQTPMTGVEITSHFEALGSGPHPPEDSHMPYNDVGPGYFQTMQTRIVEGREFAKNERSLNVCILNQSAAAFFFPHEEALDRYVRAMNEHDFPAGTACRVIGVAEDAKFSNVRVGPPRTIYFPLSKQRIDQLGNLVFLINSSTKAYAIAAFRKALAEIAPSVPLVIFVTLREQMDAALGSEELITLLSSFFGFLAVLLSALGLYGLLSASVVQRTGEIGMRLALGADRSLVIRMVLREALTMLGWGLLLGAAVLVFATRLVTAMLHGVSAFYPLTVFSVVLLLTAVTVAAALIPALRAATVDPMEALRAE
jgi:predicted permease